jgi:hypothetical protein
MLPHLSFLKIGFSGNFMVNCFVIVLQICAIDSLYFILNLYKEKYY